MQKKFTREDLLKKHETNIKSAVSGFSLAGVLGIAYIMRFIFTKNLNFYFSLTFPEYILRLFQSEKLSLAITCIIIASYIIIYFAVVLLANKNAKNLIAALFLYLADFAFFIPLISLKAPLNPEFFIDVIVHLFVVIFLIAGIRSNKAISKIKEY